MCLGDFFPPSLSFVELAQGLIHVSSSLDRYNRVLRAVAVSFPPLATSFEFLKY